MKIQVLWCYMLKEQQVNNASTNSSHEITCKYIQIYKNGEMDVISPAAHCMLNRTM